MRRNEREITDHRLIENALAEADICRIAMCDGGRPYVIPMNFGYRDGVVYLHSAAAGRKIEILQKNPQVCFEVEAYAEMKDIKEENICSTGMRYLSVIGSGEAQFIHEENEKSTALDIIVGRYTGKTEHSYSPESLARIVVIKVIIREITGKRSL